MDSRLKLIFPVGLVSLFICHSIGQQALKINNSVPPFFYAFFYALFNLANLRSRFFSPNFLKDTHRHDILALLFSARHLVQTVIIIAIKFQQFLCRYKLNLRW